MEGRHPKPTAIKQLEGNIHKERLNPNEPKPSVSIPTCPSHLSSPARREWKRIIKELANLGLITNLDRACLAAYCQAYGRWYAAEKKLNNIEKALYKTHNNNVIISPMLSIANRAMEQMHRLATEFGFTPSSRTRVSTIESEGDDPLDKLLSTRKN